MFECIHNSMQGVCIENEAADPSSRGVPPLNWVW